MVTPELPPNYWSDVNRYCGEIFSRTSKDRIGPWFIGVLARKAAWESATDKTTTELEKARVYLFNGMLKGPQYHFLRLRSPMVGSAAMSEYTITFNPKAEKIEKAVNQLEWKVPVEDYGVADLWKYNKQRKKEDATIKNLGLHLPEIGDYRILLTELERGAEVFGSQP